MNARKGMALFVSGCFSLLLLGARTTNPSSGVDESIISEAIKEGAIVVQCASGVCRNTTTQEVVGSGNEEGPFLVFPDTPQGRAAQARLQLKLQHSLT
jgi:hypothetical protein